MADMKSEIATEVIAQNFARIFGGLGSMVLNFFFDKTTGQIKQGASRYLFGNPETDEQMFMRGMAHALSSGKVTVAEHDAYLQALRKLPRERQNDYRQHVIQTWMGEKAKPEVMIEHIAEVVAYHAKLVSRGTGENSAWEANKIFYDHDQSVVPEGFNIEERIRNLRARNAELDRKNDQFWFAVKHPFRAFRGRQRLAARASRTGSTSTPTRRTSRRYI
jgi:hypothetical protein